MAINIGTTGTAGRFIGGGAGVYRHTALKLFIDPYRKFNSWKYQKKQNIKKHLKF